jgi:hypothetical protein
MKTALLIGCGSKFGLDFQNNLLSNGWAVNSISGSPNNITDMHDQKVIDWKAFTVADLHPFLKKQSTVDLIFFNQNASSLNDVSFELGNYDTLELLKQQKAWAQSYFTSCILPFYIIHTLSKHFTNNTKIAWMLSSFIYNHVEIKHADYIGNKYQNYLMMKNFSMHHPGCFFGINPGSLDITLTEVNINTLTTTINQTTANGKVIFFDGTIDTKFNIFNEDNK